jgi:hypothetical protein
MVARLLVFGDDARELDTGRDGQLAKDLSEFVTDRMPRHEESSTDLSIREALRHELRKTALRWQKIFPSDAGGRR